MWGLGSIDTLDPFKWVLILTFKEEGTGMIEHVLCARSSAEEDLRSPSLTFPNKHPRCTLVTSYRWAPLACNDQVRAMHSHSELLESEPGKDPPKGCIFPLLCLPATLCQMSVHTFYPVICPGDWHFSLYAGWGHFLWGGTYLWGRPGTDLEKSQ